ncbi:hypothetical protein M434DRAFT_36009 [Hypoxylon sp. CO27-5]|nr:hypothetical protein M434DRAFT_36009 [Hypoxylon sp. CO27-5]
MVADLDIQLPYESLNNFEMKAQMTLQGAYQRFFEHPNQTRSSTEESLDTSQQGSPVVSQDDHSISTASNNQLLLGLLESEVASLNQKERSRAYLRHTQNPWDAL